MNWLNKAITNHSRLVNLELDLQHDYETEWSRDYKNLSNKKPYRDINQYKKIRKKNLFENESIGPGPRIKSWKDLAKKKKAEADIEIARDLRHAQQLQDIDGVFGARFVAPGEQVAQEIEDAVQRRSAQRQETLARLEREERERLEQIERANAMTDVLVADMLRRTEGVRGRGKHRQHTHRKNARGTRRGNTHRKKRKHKKTRGKKKN